MEQVKISCPTLIIDEAKCRSNIQTMADKARKSNVELIPHFKTHQSLAIGEWFKAYEVSKITVSSVKMAEYFAEAGWNDIYIAFPCNPLEINAINELARRINLTLLFSNIPSIKLLSEQLQCHVNARIEIDSGAGRTGFNHEAINEIAKAIELIKDSEYIDLTGLYSHAGNSYEARSSEDILRVFDSVKSRLCQLKNNFQLPVGFGDTPCCSAIDDFVEFDSLHPGNFVFYDVMQMQIGSCIEDQIGIAVACPVVDMKKESLEIIVHGGGVHLSKDKLDYGQYSSYGKIVPISEQEWGVSFDNCFVKALSQEHGIIKVTQEVFELYAIGDVIGILPVHSCMTADCIGAYCTTKGEHLDHLKGVKYEKI